MLLCRFQWQPYVDCIAVIKPECDQSVGNNHKIFLFKKGMQLPYQLKLELGSPGHHRCLEIQEHCQIQENAQLQTGAYRQSSTPPQHQSYNASQVQI